MDAVGVERMDCSEELCVVHFTNQVSLTIKSTELAACIFDSPEMQRSASAAIPKRRSYMKEWPGKL